MTDIAKIQKAWDIQETKLEQSWKLNLHLLKKINIKSARSKMAALIWMNSLTLIFYQVVMWFCIFFISTHLENLSYILAGAVLVIWSAIISYGAIKQLKLIIEIDYASPVTTVQKQLQKVKIALIHFLRMAFMILPFYIVFPIVILETIMGISFVESMDLSWMIMQTAVLIIPTIWIYRILSPKNVDKKWINWLLQGNGSQINEAQKFLEEINQFEKL